MGELIFFGSIGALFVLMIGTMLVVGCLEKQRVRDFALVPPEKLPPPSPYFTEMNAAARQLGFHPGEIVGHNRDSAAYRCCLAFWLSPDRNSLLIRRYR